MMLKCRGVLIAAAALAWATASPTAVCRGAVAVAELSQERAAKPGDVYGAAITLRNRDEVPQAVRVYQADYLFFSDGRNVYGAPGSLDRSNADWITFSPRFLEVPPNGSATIEYAVSVPGNEALVGTYWSLIMVEELANGPLSGQSVRAEGEVHTGVRQVLRYGVQVVTHIGDTGTRVLRFADRALTATADGRRTLRADVENTGERALRPYVWVELHDDTGGRLGRFQTDRKRLYPGTSARYTIDLSDVPGGSYQALVVVDNGDEHVFGAQYNLEF
jgi:hypothetical protein